ncbi:MAG: hypothetical protein WA660_00285, partial [Candidatus Acidiferrales bacterium]
ANEGIRNRREEEFLRICEIVFTTSCSETVTFDRMGKPVFSRMTLNVDGRKVRLVNLRLFAWFLPGKRTEIFRYEPYI